MKMNKTALAVALSIGATFGAVVQNADASVYGRSYIDIDALQLGVVNIEGIGETDIPITSPADVTIRSFVSSISNTAILNNDGAFEFATCDYGSCPGGVSPVLDADPALLGAPTFGGNNDFTFNGPGADEYSRSDAVAWDSAIIAIRDGATPELVDTHTEQIAESELQTGFVAGATAAIQSTTGITISFTLGDGDVDNGFFMNFDAIWNQLVDIDLLPGQSGSSQSELTVKVELAAAEGGGFLRWTPDSDNISSCITNLAFCGVTEAGDLNRIMGISTNPESESNIGSGNFSLFATGLSSGDWTLTLNATTKTLLTRVPVPGTLAVFGLGLAAMGMVGRRRKLKSA